MSSIEDYINTNSTRESEVLQEITRFTNLHVLFPRMLSGQIQGKFLEFVSMLKQPRHILEIGTYTGYSAICLSKGLQKNGMLHTIEINDELEDIILKHFQNAGVSNKIKLHIGNASDIIDKLDLEFDLIFIDGDKREYPKYYEKLIEKIPSGGIILADNVLWGNKVIEKPIADDLYTKGIIEFNTMVKNDPSVENVILPLRDGINMIYKL